jgi:hypothetical protein
MTWAYAGFFLKLPEGRRRAPGELLAYAALY